jgi:hypothetical protein
VNPLPFLTICLVFPLVRSRTPRSSGNQSDTGIPTSCLNDEQSYYDFKGHLSRKMMRRISWISLSTFLQWNFLIVLAFQTIVQAQFGDAQLHFVHPQYDVMILESGSVPELNNLLTNLHLAKCNLILSSCVQPYWCTMIVLTQCRWCFIIFYHLSLRKTVEAVK